MKNRVSAAASAASRENYQAVHAAIRAGNLSQAKYLLKWRVRGNRRDAVAWELYGHAHFSSGNFPLAVSAFERASAIAPIDADSRARLAHAYAMTGHIDSARELLSELVQEDLPADLLLQIGISLHAVGCLKLSIRACRKALQKSPNNPQAYYDLSYYSGLAGYPIATVERLARRAIKCDPANAKYRIGLAMLLSNEDRIDEAYELIRNLGMTHLSKMSCAASIQRLIKLFRHAGDDRRLVLCHQRLVELRLRGCGFDCDC